MWIECEHNSDEWDLIRCDKITGSSIPKIMANYPKSFGEPAKNLAVNIAVAQITGLPSVNNRFTNPHMDRGHEQEPEAIHRYTEQTMNFVEKNLMYVDGDLACSPDFVINDRKSIGDIKSVVSGTHYRNIMRKDFDPAYKWQFYFNMWLCKSEFFDFVSFCADFPYENSIFICRKELDSTIFEQMENRINQFRVLINEIKENINSSSYFIGDSYA